MCGIVQQQRSLKVHNVGQGSEEAGEYVVPEALAAVITAGVGTSKRGLLDWPRST